MILFLQILLGISIAVVLLGHFVCALIDRALVYPKRLGKVQPDIPRLDPIDRPPDDLPPALASRLYFFGQQKRKGLSYTQFAVTLLDLVHRKKILVDHSTNHLYFTPLDDGEGLLPFEQTLLNFIVAATSESGIDPTEGGQAHITLSQLRAYIEEHPDRAGQMRDIFQKQVIDAFLKQGYSDEVSYEHKANPFRTVGGIILVAGVGALFGWLANNLALGVVTFCLAGLAVAVCYQVFGYKLPYLTEKGVDEKAKWLAYGEYLDSIKRREDNADQLSPERWCEIAVYAAAFEKNKTFDELSDLWETLADDYPECELYDPHFFRKICSIDHQILVANPHLEDLRDTVRND